MAKPSKNRIADPSKFSAAVRSLNPHLAGGSETPRPAPTKPATLSQVLPPPPKPKPKYRSTTEAEFAAMLDRQKALGEISDWSHESITVVIGEPPIRYTPDFLAIGADGQIRLIEIKGGFIREAAMVRFKAARKQYPCFTFEMFQKKNRQWSQIL